jgi:hypothetical protein
MKIRHSAALTARAGVILAGVATTICQERVSRNKRL